MTDGFDRGAILARRALMISSALASLHCSNTPPVTDGPVETVTLPTAEPGPSSSAVASAQPPSNTPKLPSWEAELANAPSRTVAEGLPEHVRQSLTGMNGVFTALETEVRGVWEPKGDLCNPSQPECRAAWRELGDALVRARAVADRGSRSLCGGIVEPPALSARREGYRAFLRERLKQAESHWSSVAAAFGPLAEQEWQKQVSRSNVTPPMPCLSCAAPRTFTIPTIIAFGVDSAVLDAAAKEAVKSVLAMQGNDKRDLELWGFAGAADKDATAVAKKRAEAVRDELVKQGYDKAQLSIVVIGSAFEEKNGKGRVEFLMKERPS